MSICKFSLKQTKSGPLKIRSSDLTRAFFTDLKWVSIFYVFIKTTQNLDSENKKFWLNTSILYRLEMDFFLLSFKKTQNLDPENKKFWLNTSILYRLEMDLFFSWVYTTPWPSANVDRNTPDKQPAHRLFNVPRLWFAIF